MTTLFVFLFVHVPKISSAREYETVATSVRVHCVFLQNKTFVFPLTFRGVQFPFICRCVLLFRRITFCGTIKQPGCAGMFNQEILDEYGKFEEGEEIWDVHSCAMGGGVSLGGRSFVITIRASYLKRETLAVNVRKPFQNSYKKAQQHPTTTPNQCHSFHAGDTRRKGETMFKIKTTDALVELATGQSGISSPGRRLKY